MEVIALGIGNTSLKVALVETRTLDVIERRRFPVDQEASPQDLREIAGESGTKRYHGWRFPSILHTSRSSSET